MMINESILLLTYYYHSELRNHRLLKYIGKNHLGAYLPWDMYLYKPLRKVFSKVILYDYLERMTEIGVKAVNEEIIALVRREHPKYVLWVSWQYDIHESTLETIRKEGVIVVGWFFDDEWRFNDYSRWWIPYLDYCVTNAISAVPKYRRLGARVIQTIPNTGIAIARDWSRTEERYDVSFVGGRNFIDREQYLDRLSKSGIKVDLFGQDWGGYVSFSKMIDIIQTSKINLNFSKAISYDQPRQLKGRLFQVCLAGGFMLTEYAPGTENYFEIDKEIVCFEDTEEMIAKVRYYLCHDEERRAIAQAGWERATREHTSSRMVARVFEQIEQDIAVNGRSDNDSSQELKMPFLVRRIAASYHFEWGRILLEENYKRSLWKDELELSLSYTTTHFSTWYYKVAGLFPPSLRSPLLELYGVIERFLMNLCGRLRTIIWLRKLKATVINKMLHA
ncbi:glycosyltransferase [Chloroflexota bacterium]